MIYYFLKNICITICLEKLGIGSFFFGMNYLIKHSSFKQKIKNDFSKYAIEIFQQKEKYFQIENNEIIHNIFSKKYIIDSYSLFGILWYYGIKDIIKSDKRKALIFFKKSYKLAKEENDNYFKRYEYLYIYKCRKYLLKNNEISSRKLNKTKEKLFRFYEECNLDYLAPFEIYNYYKLSKYISYIEKQNKLIDILKKGKNWNFIYCFKTYVYREKCRIALEKEYTNNSEFIDNVKNEMFDNNCINLYFKTMENRQYNLSVSKDIQFIVAVHKLYNKYPELESKKIGTYLCNGNKICIFDTIQENGLQEGNIIVIINKFNLY